MNRKYHLKLTRDERQALEALVSKGKAAARKLNRAHVLLLTDEGEEGPAWQDADVAQAASVSTDTVERVRRRAVEEGPEAALDSKPSTRQYTNKLDGAAEAYLIATACSTPPEGRARWSLQMLADKLVAMGQVDSLSYETVRKTLKKTNSSPTCASAG